MNRSSLAILACMLMTVSSLALLDGAEDAGAYTIETFKGGSDSRTVTFTGPSTDKDTVKLEIAPNATIDHATMKIRAEPDTKGEYPWNVTVNVGDDDDVEYKFSGEGYGRMGHQTFFSDGDEQKQVVFADPLYNDSIRIQIPKGATISSAEMDVRGYPGGGVVFITAGVSMTTYETSIYSWLQSQAGAHQWLLTTKQYSTSPSTYSGALHVMCVETSSGGIASGGATFKQHILDQGRAMAMFGVNAKYLIQNMGLGTNANHGYGGFRYCYIQGNYAGITQGYTGTTYMYTGGSSSGGTIERNTGFNGQHLASVYSGDTTETTFAVWDSTDTYNGNPYSGQISGKAIYWGQTMTGGTYTAAWNSCMGNAIDWAAGSGTPPKDVSIDIGNDGGSPEFYHAGEFQTEERIEGTGFVNALNGYVSANPAEKTDKYGNEFVMVPLKLESSQEGAVRIKNLTVTYDYETVIDENDKSDLASEINEHLVVPPTSENITIPVAVRSDTAGKVTLYDLNLTYNEAPWFMSMTPIFHQCLEDTPEEHLLDLSLWASDDYDEPLDLVYEVTRNSHKEVVDVFIADDHWLGVDPSKTPHWNSESQTEGLIEVRVKITDTGNRSAFSPLFQIDVRPVNDEPTVGVEIPDITVLEGEEETPVVLNGKAYFEDIEFDVLHYAAAVDPLEAVDGEEGNLTAEIDPLSLGLTVEAHGDYFTPEGVAIPVWVYCDDDMDINTIEDGYIIPDDGGGSRAEGEPVPNWTHQEVLVTVVNVNDAPVWGDVPEIVTMEDVPVEEAFLLSDYVTDIDSPPEDWEFKLRSNNNKKLKVAIDPDTSAVSLTPNPDAFGTGKVNVQVSDGDEDARLDIRVVVNPVNDAPTLDVFLPGQGAKVMGNVTFSGTADDVENALEYVELAFGEEPTWVRAEGLVQWNYIWNTADVSNGPVTVTMRCFDGELYSENVTVNLVVENPINQPPTVSIDFPTPGAVGEPGMMQIQGKSADSDGGVKKILLQIGDGSAWVTIKDPGTGLVVWNYEFNNTQWAGTNVTIRAMAADGHDRSLPFNVTFAVSEPETTVEEPPELQVGTTTERNWLGLIILIAVITAILIVIMALWVKRTKDKQKAEEERKLKEEEEEEAKKKAETLSRTLSIAQPAPPPPAGGYLAGPAGAGDAAGMYGAPLPPPPPPAPGLAPAPTAVGGGAEAGYQLPPTGWGGEPETPLLPPAPAAYEAPPPPPSPPPAPPTPPQVAQPATQPPAPPAGAPLTSVSCYNCGGMVPVTSDVRPLSITCPTCGAQGEI